MRSSRILSFLLSYCLAYQALGVKVEGVVYDSDHTPLPAVYVAEVPASSIWTITDSLGRYAIEAPTGARLEFSLLGFTPQTFIVPSSSSHFSPTLSESVEEISGIEVRALAHQTSASENLSLSTLPLISSPSGGIESLLSTLAGVSQHNELSTGYNVRGGSYDENMVYVNGIQVYRPMLIRSGQQEGLSFINPDLVESVSFSAGGFDATYDDKMSSVLDIRYKRPKGFEGSASVSLLGASAMVGSGNDKFTQIYGLRYKTSRYLLGSLDVNGEYDPNFLDFQTFLSYRPSSKVTLSFLGNFSQNKYTFTPSDRNTSFGTLYDVKSFKVYFDGHERDLFRTLFGAFTAEYTPSSSHSFSLSASVFSTDEEETYDISGEYWLSDVMGSSSVALGIGSYHEHARNYLDALVSALSFRGKWLRSSNTLSYGVSLQNERIDDRISEWQTRDSSGYSLPYNGRDVHTYYNLHSDNSLSTIRLTAFIQNAYRHYFSSGASLSAHLGVRMNYWDFNRECLVSPRASLAFSPAWRHEWDFRFASGLYSQAPFYKELRLTHSDALGNNFVVLNHDIRASQSIHFILAADHFFRVATRPFKFTAEAYYKLCPRLTPYGVDNVQIRYYSDLVSHGYTTGLDLKLFGEMLPDADSWIGLSLMRSREDVRGDAYLDADGNIHYPSWISRPSECRYAFTLFFQDYFPHMPKYKVHLRFIWSDGLPFGPPNSERYLSTFRAPAYKRADIGVSRLLSRTQNDRLMSRRSMRHIRNIWLTFEIFNLLNFKNTNSYYWVTDVYNVRYAVPNYLTSRQFNLRLQIDFF